LTRRVDFNGGKGRKGSKREEDRNFTKKLVFWTRRKKENSGHINSSKGKASTTGEKGQQLKKETYRGGRGGRERNLPPKVNRLYRKVNHWARGGAEESIMCRGRYS